MHALTDEGLKFVNVTSTAIVAGGQLFALRVIIPAMRDLPPQASAPLHQAMLVDLPHKYLGPIGMLSAISAIGILVWERTLPPLAVALLLLGLVAWLAVAIPSIINRRVNIKIADLSADDVSAQYPQMRQTWERLHVVRTAASLFVLSCYVASGLVR
jgi:hypothetical protein